MSKPLLHFLPEEDTSSAVNATEKKESYMFFSNLIGLSTVCSAFFLYLLVPWSSDKHTREVQSVLPPPLSSTLFPLEPFVVRLKTEEGFRLSKIQITLHINPSLTGQEEMKSSSSAIKDQLLFILSDKHETDLTHPAKKTQLKKDIIHHLNLFLVEGKIQTLQFKQTFLAP